MYVIGTARSVGEVCTVRSESSCALIKVWVRSDFLNVLYKGPQSVAARLVLAQWCWSRFKASGTLRWLGC